MRQSPDKIPPPQGQIGAEAQLSWARRAAPGALRDFARRYDWRQHPETVLGWVMAQPDIDLGSALVVFFNGAPDRFNRLAHRNVPRSLRGEARLLDTICQRLNAGVYLAWPDRGPALDDRTRAWLHAQEDMRAAGRRGRYVLDPARLETVLEGALRRDPAAQIAQEAPEIEV